jgi:hypothetical protein
VTAKALNVVILLWLHQHLLKRITQRNTVSIQ